MGSKSYTSGSIRRRELKSITDQINRINSTLVDLSENRFTESFYREIKLLYQSTRLLHEHITVVKEISQPEVAALVASLVVPDINTELERIITEFCKDSTEIEIEQEVLKKIYLALASIPQDKKIEIEEVICAFSSMQNIVSFPFDKLLALFENNNNRCRVSVLSDWLQKLYGVISEIDVFPHFTFIEGISLLYHRSYFSVINDKRKKKKLHSTRKRIELAYANIREFKRRVPLESILLFVYGISFCEKGKEKAPLQVLSLLYNYWKIRFECNFSLFCRQRKEKELKETALDLLDCTELPINETLLKCENYYGLSFTYTYTINVVSALLSKVFQTQLRPLFRNNMLFGGHTGNFEMKRNLSQVVEDFFRIEDLIAKLETDIQSKGEIGKVLEHFRRHAEVSVKIKNHDIILLKVNLSMEYIIENILLALEGADNLITSRLKKVEVPADGVWRKKSLQKAVEKSLAVKRSVERSKKVVKELFDLEKGIPIGSTEKQSKTAYFKPDSLR